MSPPFMEPTPVPTEHVSQAEIERPSDFIKNIRDNERYVDEVKKTILKPLCAALRGAQWKGPPTSDEFRGRWALDTQQASNVPAVALAPFERIDGFKQRLLRTRDTWRETTRCDFGISGFRRTGAAHAWMRLDMHLGGFDRSERPFDWVGHPIAEVHLKDGDWSLLSFDLGETAYHRLPESLFRDVTEAVGVSFQYESTTQRALSAQTDARQLETIGGLAVLDWNGDGHEDFVAWNQKRALRVFVNDGVGGFSPLSNLIPTSHIGYFHLWLDLDQDGRREMVSSQPIECADSKARFPIYQQFGNALRRAKTDLVFETPCGALDQLKFQHITASDIDRDGDLDLFFSGFSNRYSKNASHNHLRSQSGEANRLFVNQGQLRFSEEAGRRGLVETGFSYASVFFDYDDDEDQDLYVTNDYGPNHLYVNDGGGHFARGGGALGDNGQSMGVSEVDIDGDGRLDLYVSNMYSKAGHRIVPLAESELAPETFSELQRVASGNTAYLKASSGTFHEAGQALGIARAGWAWGHTFFDADLDGDLDLYVLNGHTTHRKARAPDY